ncbi:MAG TPA: hypothetical protein VJN18_04485 [Polyangiaceae bacterium]|nr:hypothetical protein [Polyangiaceae bacterium]
MAVFISIMSITGITAGHQARFHHLLASSVPTQSRTAFAGVVDEPGVLWNSANNPLYLLCFAVGNERGKDIALRIANHLLKGVR